MLAVHGFWKSGASISEEVEVTDFGSAVGVDWLNGAERWRLVPALIVEDRGGEVGVLVCSTALRRASDKALILRLLSERCGHRSGL